MPGTTLPPSQSDVLNGPNGLMARVERLERQARPAPTDRRFLPSLFSYAGELASGTESPPWYPESDVKIYAARVSATTAPSGSCALMLRLNGTDFTPLTLGSGLITATTLFTLTVGAGGYVTVRVTTASSAANVSIGLELMMS